MSYNSVLVEEMYIVRWLEPNVDDIREIVKKVNELGRKTDNRLIYVAIAPDSSTPPDNETRDAMVKSMDDMIQVCSSLHLVVEGTGFRNSIKRSVLTGILLASGKSKNFYVHANFDEVFEKLGGINNSVSKMNAARAAGVVE